MALDAPQLPEDPERRAAPDEGVGRRAGYRLAVIGALLGGATVMSQAAADARFLAQLGPRTLAVAMAVSSALLAVVLVVVGALADRAAKRSVLSGLSLVGAAALGGFAALAEVAPQAAAWIGFLGAKQLAAAADLSFWMLATERLDARQSVRALPRLSAVGGVGGAVSAALAVPLASAGGPSAVMVGAAGLLTLAALAAWRLPADDAAGAVGIGRGGGGALAVGGVLRRSVRDGVACVVESPLARRLAALVGLGGGFAALLYVGMAAAAAGAARGGSDAELTALLSGIRSAAQIATVAAQLVVAPWLLRKFGTARALLLSPVVAVVGAAAVAVAPSLAAFVALSIASRALDQAVETPAQKLVHTLLPAASRGRVVGFVEGIAKRSGAVVAGLVAALLVERAAGLGGVLAASALAWLGAAAVMARKMPALAVASAGAAGAAGLAGVTTRSPSLGPRALQQLKRELEEGDDEGGQERRARAIEVLVRQAAEGQTAACAALIEGAARRGRAELWEGAALALAHTPTSKVRDEWRAAIEEAVGEASSEESSEESDEESDEESGEAIEAQGEAGEAEAVKVAALGALALAGKGRGEAAGEAGAASHSGSALGADLDGAAVRDPDAEVDGAAVRDPDAEADGAAVRDPDAEIDGAAVRDPDAEADGAAVRDPDAILERKVAPGPDPDPDSSSPPLAPTDSEAVAYATAQVARWWRDPPTAIAAAADELRYGDERTRRIAADELRRYAIRALVDRDDELCLAAAWPLLPLVRRGTDEDGARVAALELLGELAQRLAGRRSAEVALLRSELRALAHQLVEARRAEALAAPPAAAAVKLLGALLAEAPSISADLGDDLALVVSLLADRDEEVSEAAAGAVRRIGVAATAALLTLAGYGRRAARDRAAALLRELPATEAALDQLVELELGALETTCLALGALAEAPLEEPASPRAAVLDALLARRLDERGREIAHTVLLLAAARHRSPPIGTAAARWRSARGRYERARALAVLDTTLPRALATRLLETVDEAAPLPRAQAVARRTDRPIPSPQEAIGGELGGGDAISRRILLARLPAAALARYRGALAGAAHQLARAADPERLLRRLASSSPAPDEGSDMPSPVEALLALSQLPLFAGLSTRQLDELARRARRRRAAAGTVIAARGQPLETLILVEEGELVIAERRVLAGELVDELAWLAPRAPEEDVLAARDCRLLELDRATFEELADDVPGLGAGVCRALAERLRG